MKKQIYERPPDGDIHRGWFLIPYCWILVCAALISTFIRLWIRIRVTRNLGWDDFWIVLALVSNRFAW